MDIYNVIWTYTDIFEHIRTYTNIFNRFQGHPEVVTPPEVVIPPSCATGGGLPPAVRHPQKKHVLDFLNMYLVNLLDFHGFEALLVVFFQNVDNLIK